MKFDNKPKQFATVKPILTMKEIAHLAGVSQTAVSAVLNNKRGTIRLSETTRQKIEKVLKEHNYRPNTAGKSLALGRSLMIGMVVTNITSSFIPQVIEAVEDCSQKHGYGLLLMTSRNDSKRQDEIIDFMLERGVEGVLLNLAEEGKERSEEKLIANRIPYVSLFNQPKKIRPGVGYVYVDGFKVGYLATKHLLKKGHRKLLMVNSCPNTNTGMEKAIVESGEKVQIEYDTMGEDNREEWIIEQWRKSKNPVTAMFIRGDECACRVMNVAMRNDIHIPQDLAIIGVDDISAATRAVVPLTTISQPKYELGEKACGMLFDMIEGRAGKECVFLPKLIVRQST
jgi:LacI family transcriptional regulator